MREQREQYCGNWSVVIEQGVLITPESVRTTFIDFITPRICVFGLSKWNLLLSVSKNINNFQGDFLSNV